MNFLTARPLQSMLVGYADKPRRIRTTTQEQFLAVIERERRGEFTIRAMDAFGPTTGNGGHNGDYEFEVTHAAA